jgi:hypothetical protein
MPKPIKITFKPKNKKVIVFDNDVVTGRTLRRVEKELNEYSPKYLDLLLIYEFTYLHVSHYKQWKKNNYLPLPDFGEGKIVSLEETTEGMDVSYRYPDDSRFLSPRVKSYTNKEGLWIKCRANVPKSFRKTMTLSKDFHELNHSSGAK